MGNTANIAVLVEFGAEHGPWTVSAAELVVGVLLSEASRVGTLKTLEDEGIAESKETAHVRSRGRREKQRCNCG